MGSEWRGVAVADRIEPKPIAPPPKDDALVMVIVAGALRGVAPPELPVVVVVDRKSYPIRFGCVAIRLNCIAVSNVQRQSSGLDKALIAGVVAAAFGTACHRPTEVIVGNRRSDGRWE
jgi:hypothetical protein